MYCTLLAYWGWTPLPSEGEYDMVMVRAGGYLVGSVRSRPTPSFHRRRPHRSPKAC